MTGATEIGVALKVAPRGIEVEPLSGIPAADPAPPGISAADEAALEIALLLAERWGAVVAVATAGPKEAEPALRDALAAGATRAVRVETPLPSVPGGAEAVRTTARALAAALGGSELVVCGDYSADGGSGAVPALLAAELDAAQALGLVSVAAAAESGILLAERRLDGGRRERLRLTLPAVISVEPGAARLRRAPLPGVLAARDRAVELIHVPATRVDRSVSLAPFRPRSRVLPAPTSAAPGERVRSLLGVAERRDPPRVVRAEPGEAAREIVEQLRRWGYA